MNVEQEIRDLKFRLRWHFVVIFFLLIAGAWQDTRLRKLEPPAKAKPAGGLLLPNHPQVPNVGADSGDQLVQDLTR